jgi:predicted transglutaminase-like cysteine proteinase
MTVRRLYLLLLLIGTALGIQPAATAGAQTTPPRLMGTVEIPSAYLAALPQWTRVLEKLDRERPNIARCDDEADACASAKMIAWRAKVQEMKSLAPIDRLREANLFVNTWPATANREADSVEDEWASPLEFLQKSGGSENFAIMKFFTLRDAGFPADALRIVVAKDVLRNKPHTFLAAYHENRIYILDNVSNTIFTQDRTNYYVPFYSVNETTRWAHLAAPLPARALPGKAN